MAAGSNLVSAQPGCTVSVNETQVVDQFLLYKALRCKGVTSKLRFAGGAKFSSLEIEKSAFFGSSAAGHQLVVIAGLNDNNAPASIEFYARQKMSQNDDKLYCYAQSGKPYGYPSDSYVVNNEEFNPNAQEQGFRCGEWGYFSDVQSFWRAFGGFTWFFQFGQDAIEFEARTFTMIERDGRGGWRVVR